MRAEFDLSGLGVSLSSESRSIVEGFASAWAPFSARASVKPTLLDVVATETSDDRLRSGPIPKETVCCLTPEGLEVVTRGARAVVRPDGTCTVSVTSDTPSMRFYAIANALLPAVAWRLPALGGLVVHAAGLVVEGRAFILLGGEAAGKTTWAEGGKAEGAGFLSDDVIALRATERGVVALSFPFRANHPAPLPPAGWPLAAVLLPKWGASAAIETASALRAHAAHEASVLYRDVLARDPAAPRVLEAIAAVPALVLVFAADGRSAPVLRAL
jgi:hypothetical protein